jgi:hypothetical protein
VRERSARSAHPSRPEIGAGTGALEPLSFEPDRLDYEPPDFLLLLLACCIVPGGM